MKKLILLFSAALCVGLTVPMRGNHAEANTHDEPDSVACEDDTLDWDGDWTAPDSIYVDEDWTGDGPADTVYTDSVSVDKSATDEGSLCPHDDELLSEFDGKQAEYELRDHSDPDHGASYNATVFFPVGNKKDSGYNRMVSRILKGSIYNETNRAKWKTDDIEKMLEARWKIMKAEYNHMREELKQPGDKQLPPVTYNLRTTVTPVWRIENHGNDVTFCIEDEMYAGGVHGMVYQYYFTYSTHGDSLIGLTDIFKEEALGDVFRLVGEKLAARPNAPIDDEVWTPLAEVTPTPTPDEYAMQTGAMETYKGKVYPRPALTACGIVFSYPPYVKDCFAAGTIHILITYEEAANWLKR